MRFSVTVMDGSAGRRSVVLVDAEPEQAVGQVLPALLRATSVEGMHPAFIPKVRVWVDGRAVDSDMSLREAGVVPGSVVALHEPAGSAELPTGQAEIRVVSGPGAGRVHRAGLGELMIGCGAPGLSLPDVQLPADALRLEVAVDGSVSATAAPGLTATIDGADLEGTTAWPAGALLRVGDTVLTWNLPWQPDTDTSAAQDRLGRDFNRPPRLLPPPWEKRFSLPREPAEHKAGSIPWLMVLAPLVMVVPMVVIMRNPMYAMMGILSPVMAFFNWLQGKSQGAKAYKEAKAKFDADSETVQGRLTTALATERANRRQAAPDPAEVMLTAVGPGHRLWERRRTDPDYLNLRLGMRDADSTIEVTDPNLDEVVQEREPHVVRDVPASISLREVGVLGVCGDADAVESTMRWLLGQAAVLHSPRDVRIVVITDGQAKDRFDWVRWLPHSRLEDEPLGAMIGNDQESIARRLGELSQLVTDRTPEDTIGVTSAKLPPGPDYIVVLEGTRRLRALPGVVSVLRGGPIAGVDVICIDEDAASLPEECRAVIRCQPDGIHIGTTGARDIADIRPDLVEPAWTDRIARALAPLRDTTPSAEDSGLPRSARLLECIGMPDPSAETVLRSWGPKANTEIVIGAGFDGNFHLDLRRDGPHALVAGTTGSGKSEFLQTIVAALALANRPDQVTFVLVDYKGGSAFKECNKLPHTVGMVTDLDTHLVGRALTSLGAELRRREHLLAVPGAKDLEDYWAMQTSDPSLPTIPRLILVIDEFASLKAELPDFVTGLVTIAQRGRSLGIHLILATQRPSGVVSADIRANTNLRIALRVTDEAESVDVIDAKDSAHIAATTPGRGYARLGPSGVLPFQAGRVGGRRPDLAASVVVDDPVAWPMPWERIGAEAPRRPKVEGADTDEGETDLSVLVAAVNDANEAAAIEKPFAPWLPALPENLTLADLPTMITGGSGHGPSGPTGGSPDGSPDGATGDGAYAVTWALEDRPDEQARTAARFALGRSGHLGIVGGPRSGRSTALRTIVAGLAKTVPTQDLHIYGLDCGNGALLPLANLPQVGAVVQRTEIERASRLLDRLAEEMVRRRDILGSAGFSDLVEQRASVPEQDRLPYILVVIDRWEGFLSDLEPVDLGRLHDHVISLVREGTSVGIQLVISGDRSLMTGRINPLLEHRIAMRLPDQGDYQVMGLKARELPVHFPDGRGVWANDATEAQVALLSADASGAGQSAAVRSIAAEATERDQDTPASRRPMSLGVLPAQIALDDVREELADPQRPPGWVPFGVGGDTLELLGLDLYRAPVAVVAGAPRTGRTSLLRLAAARAVAEGSEILAFVPRANALSDDLGDRAVVGLEGEMADQVERLRGVPERTLILVDDASAYREGEWASLMGAIVRQAQDKRFRVVVAGRTEEIGGGFSGWMFEARKDRQGLILSPPDALAADMFGQRVARTSISARPQPGRGVFFDGSGEQVLVQVPYVGD